MSMKEIDISIKVYQLLGQTSLRGDEVNTTRAAIMALIKPYIPDVKPRRKGPPRRVTRTCTVCTKPIDTTQSMRSSKNNYYHLECWDNVEGKRTEIPFNHDSNDKARQH